ncbi:MAG: TldD/PmbA family protein [Methanocellales archaeon]|nr:TldD/PmbA family protein [Methanocellales archaeon]
MDADFHDIKILETSNTSIILDNGAIEEIATSFSKRAGVRVLVDGSWGFTSTDDIDAIDDALRSATTLAMQAHEKAPCTSFPIITLTGPTNIRHISKVKKDPRDVPVEEKVQLLKDIEQQMKLPQIVSTNVHYSESEIHMIYTNSEGAECESKLTRCGFGITAIAKDGDLQMGSDSRFGVCGYEIFNRYDALSLANDVATAAVQLLSAKASPGGHLPVILDPKLAGVFIHEALGHAAEADLVLEGCSILKGEMGKRIASELISVHDDPTLPEFGYYPFDDEGVLPARTTIIQDGVLNHYLHSRETAARLGFPKSGNARAQGCGIPIVRMSNTFIEEGDASFDEMVEDIQYGIYLIGSRGGQTNPGEGVFQFNAEKGRLIENGSLTTPLRNVSLSGNTLEILKNVVAVGNDLKYHSGLCGKNGQLMPVSDGAPHIMISSAMVGGSA